MSEYSPRLTLKPANSIVASLGTGMHALSRSMRTNTPGRPSASTTSTAALTSGSVSEARTGTGGGRVPCRGAVAVRLFDPQTPRAPLRDELARRARTGARRRPVHPRAGGRGVRAGVRRLARHGARRRRRERHRGDHDRAAGAGRRARRRGRRAVVHVLRERRGDPADRRDPRLLRRRSRDVRRDARGRARRPHAAHEGRDPRAPVRQRRAGRGGRGARRPRARGRRAGDRLAAGRRADRRAGHDRDVLLLPVEEPRRPRRRRRDLDRRRRARRARAHAALPRLAGQGDVHGDRLQQPPRRAAGRRAARPAAAPARVVRGPPRRRARVRRRRARRPRAPPGPGRGRRPGLEPLRRAPPAPRGAGGRAARPGDRRAHVLLRPRAPPAGARRPRARRRPARDRGGRADPSRAADGRRRSREEQVGEVVAAVRAAEL